MNVKGIKRAEDLYFEVPEALAVSINNLVDAMERDDVDFDLYQDDLDGAARMVEEEYDDWIYSYYLEGGWREDVID